MAARAKAVRTYAAFLRGINVGGHAKLAMADLRELLTGLGYTDVRTLLQSGNAVFRAPATPPARLEADISAAIEASLGLTVSVIVRSPQELAAVVERTSLTTTEPAKLQVLFLATPLAPGQLDAVDPAEFAPEEFELAPGEIVVWCARGVIESKALKAFSDKRLGRAVTARNWNTVTKMLALATAD